MVHDRRRRRAGSISARSAIRSTSGTATSASSRRSSARPTSCASRRRTRCSRRRPSSRERLLAMAGPGLLEGVLHARRRRGERERAKIARLVTGRLKNVARYRSYHGASMGALALTGDWRRPAIEPALPGVVHVQDCYCDRCPFGKRVETLQARVRDEHRRRDAARGPASVARCSSSRCRARTACSCRRRSTGRSCARRATRRARCSSPTRCSPGFGRTGKPFGFQHWDVVPDMITVAKGLASGYATIGAVIVHERVAKHFDDHVLACGLTYYAHPTACAAAVETLKVYEDEQLYENAARLGPGAAARARRGRARGLRARRSCARSACSARSRSRRRSTAWGSARQGARGAQAVAARRRQARHGDLRAAAVHHASRSW